MRGASREEFAARWQSVVSDRKGDERHRAGNGRRPSQNGQRRTVAVPKCLPQSGHSQPGVN
jgi:hypothetical protein